MISKEHLNILKEESGITGNSAKHFNLKTEKNGIAFPYFDLKKVKIENRIKLVPALPNRIKPGKFIKYYQPKGSNLNCFFHPEDIGTILNPNLKIFITEGEKKLIALHQIKELSNYPIVSYPGCWNWGSKDENNELQLSPIWNQIPFKSREVIWLPDTDFFTKEHPRKGMMEFINRIIKKGAFVKLIDLRYGENNEWC